MDTDALEKYRRRLLDEQRAMFDEFESIEQDLHVIEQDTESELEERAQEQAAASLLTRLQEHDAAALQRIHDALWRVRNGTYGLCTECEEPIAGGRLDALPTAALCIDCEEEFEDLQRRGIERVREELPASELPTELDGLEDEEIARVVRETLEGEMGDAMVGLSVGCLNGVVQLDGELPSDELRQVAKKIIETEIGLAVLDRVRLTELATEPAQKVRPQLPEDVAAEIEPAISEQSEDVFEAAEDGADYNPPSRPVPERE